MGLLADFIRKTVSMLPLNEALREHMEIIRPGIGSAYTDRNAAAMYRGWVYVAASMNADAVSASELKLYSIGAPKVSRGRKVSRAEMKALRKYAGKAMDLSEEIENHPILDLLNSPNGYDTQLEFIKKVDLFLELTGDAFILKERNERGIPVALHVLYSQFVTIQESGTGVLQAYNYGVARDGKFEYRYAPEDIIHVKFFDPNDQWYGISPLQACARSVGLINSMDTYEEALNRNMGIPAGVLRYKNNKIKDEDRQLIETRWQQKFAGVGRSGKVVVTDQDVEYDSIGVTPRDMQFLDGRNWSREEILAAFRLPMAMLLTEGVNRSNMQIAQENYYHWTVLPRQILIADGLTRGLMEGTLAKGNAFLAFEDARPVDVDQDIEKTKLLAANRAITVNELRQRLGVDEIPGGDEFVSGGSPIQIQQQAERPQPQQLQQQVPA